jgi:hypothetical protein
MLMRFVAQEITGTRIREDGSAVGIMCKCGEDEIEVLIPTQNVASVSGLFRDIVETLSKMNPDSPVGLVQARFPATAVVKLSPSVPERPVIILYDQGAPSQAAYAVSQKGAHALGKMLLATARAAARHPQISATLKIGPPPVASKESP